MFSKARICPRNAHSVARLIYKEIPDTEKEFLQEMHNLIREFDYAFPENLPCKCWSKIEIIIYKYIRDVKSKWKRRIIDIYTGNMFSNIEEILE